MTTNPLILIPQDTVIGYGHREVARVAQPIELRTGNHYLLARNGRGKTTLLRTLARSLRPLRGEPRVEGRVQFIGEHLSFDPELPARTIFRSLLDGAARQKAEELAALVELDTGKPFARLSRGNRQKVMLVMAELRAASSPSPILLLDEPFTGLDTHARERFLDHWMSHTTGILRLITTHPDHDGHDLLQPVVITDGVIRMARSDEGHLWGQLKTHLN